MSGAVAKDNLLKQPLLHFSCLCELLTKKRLFASGTAFSTLRSYEFKRSKCFFRVGHPTALILKGYHRALPFAGLLTCCVLFPQERSSFRTLQGASVSLLQGFYSLFLTTYYHRIASCQEIFQILILYIFVVGYARIYDFGSIP